MPIVSSRNTIHMVINNEVEDINQFIPMHWSSCKYAVLIPLKSIPKGQIKSGNPLDTFVEGNLQLNGQCWVLCPSGEEETLRKNSAIKEKETALNKCRDYFNQFIENKNKINELNLEINCYLGMINKSAINSQKKLQKNI